MTLKELQIGKSAVIKSVGSHGALRQHFLDMGMIPGDRKSTRLNSSHPSSSRMPSSA